MAEDFTVELKVPRIFTEALAIWLVSTGHDKEAAGLDTSDGFKRFATGFFCQFAKERLGPTAAKAFAVANGCGEYYDKVYPGRSM